MAMNIVQLSDSRTPPPKRESRKKPKQQSRYELYPMPFFNKKKLCTWDVKPTGAYGADCETGRAFAIEFLQSCDKTYGWASLLPAIVTDMIEAGDTRNRGIVVGFMGLIGSALVHSRVLDRLD
jgi:hypothetical protein